MYSESIKNIANEFQQAVKELNQKRCVELLALAREKFKEEAQSLLDNIIYWITERDEYRVEGIPEGDGSDPDTIRIQMLEWLIREGTTIDNCDGAWNTGLARAVVNCSSAVVKLFLDHGANIHARNERGWNLFHLTCHQGSPEVIDLLLDRGAQINARVTGERNITGLMLAADRLHISLIKLLLERGADPSLTDDSNLTAHHYAKYSIASMCDSPYKPSQQTADEMLKLLPPPAISDEISNAKYTRSNCPLCRDVEDHITEDRVDGWQSDIRKYFIFALKPVYRFRQETGWRIVTDDAWFECPHCGSCFLRTITEDTDDVWYPRYSMELFKVSRERMEKGIEETKSK